MPASKVHHLMIYFGLAYFAQGIGQAGALINQPLMYYLKSLGFTTDQVAGFLAVLTVPVDHQARLRSHQRLHSAIRLSQKKLSRTDEYCGGDGVSVAHGIDGSQHDRVGPALMRVRNRLLGCPH